MKTGGAQDVRPPDHFLRSGGMSAGHGLQAASDFTLSVMIETRLLIG
jgi:hypothetical protein